MAGEKDDFTRAFHLRPVMESIPLYAEAVVVGASVCHAGDSECDESSNCR